MTSENTLAEVVRTWAKEMLPGQPAAADAAAAVARQAFVEGASVSDACQAARTFLQSWSSHPAHWVPVHADHFRLVS